MKTFTILQLSSKTFFISIRRISASPFACLLEKYCVEVDQNGLELFFLSRLLKNHFLQHFFSLRTTLRCFLYLIISFFDLDFIALIVNWEHFIIAECSVLLTWGLWLPRRIVLFLVHACLKLQKYNTNMNYVNRVYLLTQIENLYT